MSSFSRRALVLERRNRNGFTFIELLVVLVIIVILIALLVPVISSWEGREPARRMHCKNNLKQIGLALHNYHDTYGSLPPAYTVDVDGNRLHSWRTLILPFIEQQALYDQIDLSKPWNDPANAAVFKTARVQIYACPSTELKDSQTTYLAVVGPETAFSGLEARSFDDIEDGLSNTLLVFETDDEHAVPWMEPVDADPDQFIEFDKNPDTLAHTGGMQALIGDGAVRFISQEVTTATRQALLTVAGGDKVADF